MNPHSAAQWENKSHQTKSIFGLLRTSCAFVECIQTAGLDCEGFLKRRVVALVKFLALLFVELYTVAAELESTLQLNLHSAAQWGNKSH